ncbi:hypothetical protein PENSPDRAFT_575893, partial [Peniophora sp. CONT]
MSSSDLGNAEFLSALDKVLGKYFDEKRSSCKSPHPSGTPLNSTRPWKQSKETFWKTYLDAARDEDEARPRDWDGTTGSILTFTGLFAATVAAFVIESYKLLQPDSGDQTVLILSQLLAATTNASSLSIPSSLPGDTFRAPVTAVDIANALWFCSLVVALACALLATLIQQWSRDYVRDLKKQDTLDESFQSRALNHVYIRMGVDRYGMDEVVYIIVTLIHLSVILFAAGLLLFLFPVNSAVAWSTMAVLFVFGAAYVVAGTLAILDTSCPYRTPLTYPLAVIYRIL